MPGGAGAAHVGLARLAILAGLVADLRNLVMQVRQHVGETSQLPDPQSLGQGRRATTKQWPV